MMPLDAVAMGAGFCQFRREHGGFSPVFGVRKKGLFRPPFLLYHDF
jgi:hypothetical protein